MGIPDGITSHLFDGATVVINENNINSNTSDRFDFFRGIIETPKFIGFSLLPLCFIFVPYSIVNLIKKHDINFRYLIVIFSFSLNRYIFWSVNFCPFKVLKSNVRYFAFF